MRFVPDDDVRRFSPRWLGWVEFPWPFHARYLAWGVGLATFVAILAFEAVVPFVSVGVPPLWEFCVTVLATNVLMTLVDYDRPIRSLWRPMMSDLTAPRRPATGLYRRRTCTARIRVAEEPTDG